MTPSRSAILASLLPADTDPVWFLRQLGIEKVQAIVNGVPWVLTSELIQKILIDIVGEAHLIVDNSIYKAIENEDKRRRKNLEIIKQLKDADSELVNNPIIIRLERESQPIPMPWPEIEKKIPVVHIAADPVHVNHRIEFAKFDKIKAILGKTIRWDPEDSYGYTRAYKRNQRTLLSNLTVLDPTAGGGSIPFEALRLGHNVIANELNPIATVILYATLYYPAFYGIELLKDIKRWGNRLIEHVEGKIKDVTPFSPLPVMERIYLRNYCVKCPEVIDQFDIIEHDQTGLIYCRQVTCPHCMGEAPLLNTCWLAREGEQWGVKIIPDSNPQHGKVRFETYHVKGGKGPKGEDPHLATVKGGVGICVHCKQAISGDEIKAQARGESPHGKWKDRLYCVVAVRFQPKLDHDGLPVRYKGGERKGEIKTEKVRFFRPPNDQDIKALEEAEHCLNEKWSEWETKGLIPIEEFPAGNDMRPKTYGMPRWCDLG